MEREPDATPFHTSGPSPSGTPVGPLRGGEQRDPGLRPATPGLDAFWLEADQQASAQDPIERELGHRLDTLARYTILIEAALAEGRDRAVEILLRQREREEALVRRLRSALRRTRGERG
ncbi:MAG: hypothetical protein DIU52_004915 [bacterium]|jgi:hypothetical protein|nr:MAG: hypothetical protein DIU52_11675 [bacterium]